MKIDLYISVLLAPVAFGLTGWILALRYGFSRKKGRTLLPLSWCACALALWFPLYSIHRWAQLGDTAAILDCAQAYVTGASVLLAVNLIITAIGVFRGRKQK